MSKPRSIIPADVYTNFESYCKYMIPKPKAGEWDWFHSVIMQTVDKAINNKNGGFVIIEMPPRCGKTLIGGDLLASYFTAKNPNKSILYATHSTDMAKKFCKSRLRKNLMFTPKYKQLFPHIKLKYELDGEENTLAIKEERKSSTLEDDKHSLVDGYKGEFTAVSVNQGTAGISGDLIIVDDYMAKWGAAQSEVIRNNINEWFMADIVSRIEPGVLLIMFCTRWHNEDVIGMVKQMVEDNTDPDFPIPEVITFRAIKKVTDDFPYDIREVGDSLWDCHKMEWAFARKNPTIWECEYQQDPISAGSMNLNLSMFHEYHLNLDNPECPVYISIDTNMDADAIKGDGCGITVWYLDRAGKYLIDVIWERFNLVTLTQEILKLTKRFPRYVAVLIEARANGNGLYDYLWHEHRIQRLIKIQPLAMNGKIISKNERFQLCLPEFHAGHIYVPTPYDCSMVTEFKRQLVNFTGVKGGKDDLVDSTSMFLNYIRMNTYYVSDSGDKAVVHIQNNNSATQLALSMYRANNNAVIANPFQRRT